MMLTHLSLDCESFQWDEGVAVYFDAVKGNVPGAKYLLLLLFAVKHRRWLKVLGYHPTQPLVVSGPFQVLHDSHLTCHRDKFKKLPPKSFAQVRISLLKHHL